MMNQDNKQFVKAEREEILSIIKEFNEQVERTDFAFDTDRQSLRDIRNSLIETVDMINHLEYKELI